MSKSLYKLIDTYFSNEDIHNICHELGVEYENLPGKRRIDKARALVEYFSQRERLPELIEYCKEQRPKAPWQIWNAQNDLDGGAKTTRAYIQVNLKEPINVKRHTELVDRISEQLDIKRHEIQIFRADNTRIIIKMPGKSAAELVKLPTSRSKELRGELNGYFSVTEIKLLSEGERKTLHKLEAKKFITERCLIAADVDKTLIDQGGDRDSERQTFRKKIAPRLIEAASMGTHIAAITGNSMNQLSSRFFQWILRELVNDRDITPLANFHLFCSSGGIYLHFDPSDETFKVMSNKVRENKVGNDEVIKEFILETDSDSFSIHPRFVDTSYLRQTAIPEQDVRILTRILEDTATEFQNKLVHNIEEYRKDYLINSKKSEDNQKNISGEGSGILYELFDKTGQPIIPSVDTRFIQYGKDKPYKSASVQITVSPILSFRHGKDPSTLFGKDFRSELTQAIQSELDRNGLNQYVARPGGRTSIDVTLEKVDKAYAVEFLIDRLNLQASSRMDKEFGSNAIYFGDEVIVGDGNDYSVTRIPGLLVFAVNEDRDLVPSLSKVFVPSTIYEGPQAVAEELIKYISESNRLIEEYCRAKEAGKDPIIKTSIEALKEKIFVERIKNKINNWDISSREYSPKDLELMHVLVTLLCRDDPIAHQWLSILVDQLDAIMTYLEESSKKDVSSMIKAIGFSHDR